MALFQTRCKLLQQYVFFIALLLAWENGRAEAGLGCYRRNDRRNPKTSYYLLADKVKCRAGDINKAFSDKTRVDGCSGDGAIYSVGGNGCSVTATNINANYLYTVNNTGPAISCYYGLSFVTYVDYLKWNTEDECNKGAKVLEEILSCEGIAECYRNIGTKCNGIADPSKCYTSASLAGKCTDTVLNGTTVKEQCPVMCDACVDNTTMTTTTTTTATCNGTLQYQFTNNSCALPGSTAWCSPCNPNGGCLAADKQKDCNVFDPSRDYDCCRLRDTDCNYNLTTLTCITTTSTAKPQTTFTLTTTTATSITGTGTSITTTSTKATTVTTTATATTSTTTVYDPGNIDCVEQQDECTAACEAADQRNYKITKEPAKKGKKCDGPTDCKPGDGQCPAATTTTSTTTTILNNTTNTTTTTSTTLSTDTTKKSLSGGGAAAITIIILLLVAGGVFAAWYKGCLKLPACLNRKNQHSQLNNDGKTLMHTVNTSYEC